jgi:anti-anti-sigma regulatory factor
MEEDRKLEKREENGITIYTFPSFLDETNTWKIFDTINNDLWDFVDKKVVLNFTYLRYLNSRALWSLSEIYSILDENKWKAYICNCDTAVGSILDLIGADYVLPVVATEEEAIKLLLNK